MYMYEPAFNGSLVIQCSEHIDAFENVTLTTNGRSEHRSCLVYQARPSSPRKVREGLADVISMHEMLTNQILLFHFETVATPWLQYVGPILVQF